MKDRKWKIVPWFRNRYDGSVILAASLSSRNVKFCAWPLGTSESWITVSKRSRLIAELTRIHFPNAKIMISKFILSYVQILTKSVWGIEAICFVLGAPEFLICKLWDRRRKDFSVSSLYNIIIIITNKFTTVNYLELHVFLTDMLICLSFLVFGSIQIEESIFECKVLYSLCRFYHIVFNIFACIRLQRNCEITKLICKELKRKEHIPLRCRLSPS